MFSVAARLSSLPSALQTACCLARAILASAAIAVALQAQGKEPKHDPHLPASDGGGCSGSQGDGRLGAGGHEIGEGYWTDYKASVLLSTLSTVNSVVHVSPPDFLTIPTAGDADGTVISNGDLLVHLDLIDTVPVNDYAFDLELVYRSSRQVAWEEMGWSGQAASATNGLDKDWNLSAVDRATIVGSPGANSMIRHTSGTGSYSTAQEIAAPPGVTGTFWAVDHGFSIFRQHTWLGQVVLDRHRPDGSVMRYELAGGDWRPKTFYDPYDNAYGYDYTLAGSTGKLKSITDPRGTQTAFDWTATTLTVTRWRGGVQATELTETLSLDPSGRITGYTGPSTSYVNTAATGIFDLTQPVTAPRALTLGYHLTLGLLNVITDVRTNTTILTAGYGFNSGRYRVSTQTDMHAGTHVFTYATNGAGQVVTTYVDPLNNTYTFDHDANGYPATYTVTPNPAPVTPGGVTGRPRAAAGDTPEPNSLQWGLVYSGCGCGQITHLQYPSGRNYDLTYDSSGNMLTWSTLSPTGTGTDTYTWTYTGIDRGNRPLTYTPPASPTENASLLYTYEWVARSNGVWGEKPTRITVTSSPVGLVNGGNQTLSSWQTLDSKGRPITNLDTGGTYTDFFYKVSGPGVDLLDRAERRAVGALGTQKIVVAQDDYGRVSSIKEGTDGNFAETLFTFDALGRTLTETVNPGSSQPAMVTTLYRDAFENVAVTLHNNLDYNGQGPKYDDGTGSPRANVRSDYVFFYDRLVDAYVDRRPLPDAIDVANPTGGGNPWLLHYRIDYDLGGRVATMQAPNGSIMGYVWDGYGTLYKVTGDQGTGGINQDLGRYYFDNDLVLKERRAPVKVNGSTTTATLIYTRNHAGQGYTYQATLPDGVRRVLTFDRMRRVTKTEVFDAGLLRKQFTEAVYDQLGRTQSTKRWLLDANGNTSGAPAQVDYLYNLRSQVTEVTAPLGRRSFRTYDEYGRLKTAHDNLSAVATGWNEVELTYMTGRDLVTAAVSKVFEESNDNAPPSGVRKDYRTEFEYDLLGRVLKTRRKGLVGGAATPLEATYSYNSLGEIAFFQEPQQQGTTNQFTRGVFDAAGRWVQLIRSGGTNNKIVLRSEYVDAQAASKETEVKRYDGRGFLTRSQFDALYRLQNHYRPGYTTGPMHKTIVQYDVGSMIDRVVDGNTSEILYARDIAGRVTARTVTPGPFVSLNATREQFAFDSIGRLAATETDAYGAFNIPVVTETFSRDSLDRLLQESYAYLGTGASTFNVTSGFGYTGSQPVGDPAFRRSVTYPSGLLVTTEPDALGRLEEVKLTPPGSAQFTLAKYRYASGAVLHRQTRLGSTGPLVDTSMGFDDHGRLGLLQHQIGSSAPFDKYSYTWNSADDLIRKKHELGTTTAGELFQYDAFHRLTGAKQGVPAPDADGSYAAASYAKEVLYTLDPGQNRTSVVVNFPGGSTTAPYATESDSSRYSQAEGVTPLYDGEGNMVFDGTRFFMYDFRNRLSEVYGVYETAGAMPNPAASQGVRVNQRTANRIRRPDLATGRTELTNRAQGRLVPWARQLAPGAAQLRSSAITASGPPGAGESVAPVSFELRLEALYGYDPFNRRVLRIDLVNGGDLRYAYDGWREVEELSVSGGTVTDRKASVWGHGVGELLSYQRKVGSSWTGYYPFEDEQGTVVRLLDGSGNTVERVEYDPYGKASWFWTGTPGAQASSQVGNPWTYATGRFDGETGLLYLRNRYLKVEFGRFCTVDPLGGWMDPAGMGNPYCYAGNAESMLTDGQGLMSVREGGGSGGIGISNSGGGRSDAGWGMGGGPPGDGKQYDSGGWAGTPTTASPPSAPKPVARCKQPWPHPIGTSECEAIRDALKDLAEKSEDYASFLKKLRNGSSVVFDPDWRGGKVGEDVAHSGYDSSNPGYVDGPLSANGPDNLNHYAGALLGGWLGGAVQGFRDSVDYSRAKTPEEKLEKLGEYEADSIGVVTSVNLQRELQHKAVFFAYDDAAWAAVRHIVWEAWYKWFCKH